MGTSGEAFLQPSVEASAEASLGASESTYAAAPGAVLVPVLALVLVHAFAQAYGANTVVLSQAEETG